MEDTDRFFDMDASSSLDSGEFEVYCAICGATTIEVDIGSIGDYEYDEDVIGDEDVEWCEEVRTLGFNPDAPGTSKY